MGSAPESVSPPLPCLAFPARRTRTPTANSRSFSEKRLSGIWSIQPSGTFCTQRILVRNAATTVSTRLCSVRAACKLAFDQAGRMRQTRPSAIEHAKPIRTGRLFSLRASPQQECLPAPAGRDKFIGGWNFGRTTTSPQTLLRPTPTRRPVSLPTELSSVLSCNLSFGRRSPFDPSHLTSPEISTKSFVCK